MRSFAKIKPSKKFPNLQYIILVLINFFTLTHFFHFRDHIVPLNYQRGLRVNEFPEPNHKTNLSSMCALTRANLTLLHEKNKCADQSAHSRSLISAFVIHYMYLERIGAFRNSQSDVIFANAHITGRLRIGQP